MVRMFTAVFVAALSLISTAIWAEKVKLSWKPQPNALEYVIEVAADTSFVTITKEYRTDKTSYDLELANGKHFVRIAGVNKPFQGPWSDFREYNIGVPGSTTSPKPGGESHTEPRVIDDSLEIWLNQNFYMAICLYQLGDPAGAEALFKSVFAKDPGYTVRTRGATFEITSAGKTFLICDPRDYLLHPELKRIIAAHESMFYHFMSKGERTKARQNLLRIARIDPYNDTVARFLAGNLEN